MFTAEQKYNMHNFVCSLQRPSAPVISIIIATCLIAAMIHATPCTSLSCTTISMSDTAVYIFLIASFLFSKKKKKKPIRYQNFITAESLYAINLISFFICHRVSISAFHFSATFLYQCLYPPTPYSLHPSLCSSVIMTFKRSSCFYMMARQYDSDTVLHYVSALLGLPVEHSVKAFS